MKLKQRTLSTDVGKQTTVYMFTENLDDLIQH